jgi:hypothetical protein
MVPVFAGLGVVIVAALAVTMMIKKPSEASETTQQPAAGSSTVQDVFSDIDKTVPTPMRKGGKGRATTNNAPPGLAENAAFAEGRKLAAEATTLYDEAVAANKAGDRDTYAAKASLAREKYERALEVTADWQINLIAEWTSTDVQVEAISKEIEGWHEKLNKVRKVH